MWMPRPHNNGKSKPGWPNSRMRINNSNNTAAIINNNNNNNSMRIRRRRGIMQKSTMRMETPLLPHIPPCLARRVRLPVNPWRPCIVMMMTTTTKRNKMGLLKLRRERLNLLLDIISTIIPRFWRIIRNKRRMTRTTFFATMVMIITWRIITIITIITCNIQKTATPKRRMTRTMISPWPFPFPLVCRTLPCRWICKVTTNHRSSIHTKTPQQQQQQQQQNPTYSLMTRIFLLLPAATRKLTSCIKMMMITMMIMIIISIMMMLTIILPLVIIIIITMLPKAVVAAA
mmetsp:Transcript_22789/g.63353  ORF Transcript_22789/g.63353 Transcript_22789/m.63353 type:complete len:287 (-) Transcript_22789:523-1383(-)